MPFVSNTQRRKFYATPSLHQYIPEFNQGTPAILPERVRPKKRTPHPAHTAITHMLAAGGNHR